MSQLVHPSPFRPHHCTLNTVSFLARWMTLPGDGFGESAFSGRGHLKRVAHTRDRQFVVVAADQDITQLAQKARSTVNRRSQRCPRRRIVSAEPRGERRAGGCNFTGISLSGAGGNVYDTWYLLFAAGAPAGHAVRRLPHCSTEHPACSRNWSMKTPISLSLLVAACCLAPIRAADKPEYNRDIRPIFAENCFACHGPDSATRKAELRLDLRDDALQAEAFVPASRRRAS